MLNSYCLMQNKRFTLKITWDLLLMSLLEFQSCLGKIKRRGNMITVEATDFPAKLMTQAQADLVP